ncbi:MAG: DSD1 family PLP-dependent enzyme [Alphaproteobacteria bacterium]
MVSRPPARIGDSIEDVDTPALVVELDAFEENLAHMARSLEGSAIRLRPHSKTHKSPMVAAKQIALGAVGVCCQTVAEAEAMVMGGVRDVLVSNEVVGERKIARLAALARQARLGVCVDDAGNAEALAGAARAFGATLETYVEVDVGSRRCGVDPGAPARDLARRVAAAPGLRFAGLQGYFGSAQHVRAHAERRVAIAEAAGKLGETKALIEKDGIACPVVTGAGTGTYRFEAASGVYTEVQPGSYVFMDRDYARNLGPDGAPARDFRHSLFVLATVMSRPATDRAVLDAGLKALAFDSGPPAIDGQADAEYVRAADEHGVVRLGEGGRQLRLGDKVRLIPGHCDPTVNLHDWYVGVRGGRVEALWLIAARGAGT